MSNLVLSKCQILPNKCWFRFAFVKYVQCYLHDINHFVTHEVTTGKSVHTLRGVTRGAQFPGRQFTMGRWIIAGALKSPNNVTRTFFNTANLPSKELRFDHRGAKPLPWGRRFDQGGTEFVFCPGRHITSLHPCIHPPPTLLLRNSKTYAGFDRSVWKKPLKKSATAGRAGLRASAGLDWKHFCGAPLSGVCKNFW